MIKTFELLIYSTLLFTPPLLISALGFSLTSATGVINIGIDGFMTVGAFVGATTTYFFKNPYVGLLCAGLSACISSLIFSLLTQKLKLNEILIGFTLNILLPSIVIIISYMIFNATDSYPLAHNIKIPILFKNLITSDNTFIKFISNIFSTYLTSYLSIILIFIFHFVIYKTSIGLKIRSCGINYKASYYVGIDTQKTRSICILVSCFLYGVSGSIYTMAITNQFRLTSICGQGYIALAASLFGKSNPYGILLYCLIFGCFSGLKILIPATGGYIHLVQMIPYVVTIIIFIIKNKRNCRI